MGNRDGAQEVVCAAAMIVLMMYLTNTLEPAVRWVIGWFV